MLQQDDSYSKSTNTYNDAFNQSKPYESTWTNEKPFLAKVTDVTNNLAETDTQNSSNHEILFVEQNDVVSIESCINDKWYLAKSDQLQGRLAINCCHILDGIIPVSLCQYLIDNNYYDLHVCFASFVAQDVGDLSITRGDIIVATNQVNEHWVQGQVCFDSQANSWPTLVVSQQVGSFPLNHCWRLDAERVKTFCHAKIRRHQSQPLKAIPSRPPSIPTYLPTTHSASLSSGSSSLHSSDSQQNKQLPLRPQQLPRPMVHPNVEQQTDIQQQQNQKPSILTTRQQDKLKGWLHIVKKKTARLSTRITASLGLISLTRDEEFERHHETFKRIEKTIRVFIKNLTTFVEHFESFLLALQNTSENLADFYRDKSHQRELDELRRKNKALACEHFHAFRRTVDRQVVAVASQLLQKFTGPHQMINKRSAKLLDYDTKTKEMESCRDLEKKAALRDHYVIAKDIYDRINRQLIEELPVFNQVAINIFRECILILLEGRRNLVLSYTKQTASLLDTPLMMTYTASDVASSIFMSCDPLKDHLKQNAEINELIEQNRKDSGQTSGHGTRLNSAIDDDVSRPHSAASQLSSEFDRMAIAAREISSTPLSQVSGSQTDNGGVVRFDEPDCGLGTSDGLELVVGKSRGGETDGAMNSDDGGESVKKEEIPKERRKKRKLPIYIASWPFVATGPNQLSITCKQALKLVKGCDECGNSDWSLVQDKRGQLGYVPSSYIVKKE